MSIYFVTVYNDMGQLLITNFNTISEDIRKAIYRQAHDDLYEATDNKGIGCLFHILKDGKDKYVTLEYKDNIISIIYDVYHFDESRMIKMIPTLYP